MTDSWLGAMLISEIIFWLCLAVVIYGYVGYPALLGVLVLFLKRPVGKVAGTPSLSIVICAYNEAEFIASRLDNLLSLDYPRQLMEIIVASDCSNDATDEIVESYRDRGVSLARPFPERRGKAELLNYAIPRAKGEVVVLSDARQSFERDAVRKLTASIADPDVGAVTGELHLSVETETAISEGISVYWRYEKMIRRLESAIDSVTGATGGIYALRRKLFRPISVDTAIDDVAIPMDIVMQGYRVVFEPAAEAFDRAAASSREEWTRKVRTLAGNYAILFQMPELLVPWRNRIFLQYFSHRVINRLVVPFALIAIFVANLFLREGLYSVTLAAQFGIYALGAAGLLLESNSVRLRFLALPSTLVLLNASAVAALLHFLTKPRLVLWEKGRS